MYQVINENTILNVDTGQYIPADPQNRQYIKYLSWLEAGNEPFDPPLPPPPSPNWKGFLIALRSTSVFNSLREASRLDISFTALASELRITLGEAALGAAEPPIIQGLVNELIPHLTTEQLLELQTVVAEYNVPLVIDLPSQEP